VSFQGLLLVVKAGPWYLYFIIWPEWLFLCQDLHSLIAWSYLVCPEILFDTKDCLCVIIYLSNFISFVILCTVLSVLVSERTNLSATGFILYYQSLGCIYVLGLLSHHWLVLYVTIYWSINILVSLKLYPFRPLSLVYF